MAFESSGPDFSINGFERISIDRAKASGALHISHTPLDTCLLSPLNGTCSVEFSGLDPPVFSRWDTGHVWQMFSGLNVHCSSI